VTDTDILKALNDVFRRVFEDRSIELTPSMTADDIAGWDSMTQITLAVEIEHTLHVKFKTSEMEKLRDAFAHETDPALLPAGKRGSVRSVPELGQSEIGS